jgi:hypothetical protein
MSASGPRRCVASLRSWRRKSHGRPNPRQTKSHRQAALQSVPRQSLRRLDRPGKSETLDGSGPGPRRRGASRCAPRRPLPLAHAVAGGQGSRRRWRLSRSREEREARFHLGLEVDAGTGIGGDRPVDARRRRHPTHPDARAILKRRSTRRSPPGLGRRARKI